MDDTSVTFHDMIFLNFLPKYEKKPMSWKDIDMSSVKSPMDL